VKANSSRIHGVKKKDQLESHKGEQKTKTEVFESKGQNQEGMEIVNGILISKDPLRCPLFLAKMQDPTGEGPISRQFVRRRV